MKNQLILGNNLDVLREIEDESVDLIYADPPFFSNRTYEFEGDVCFEDRWTGGINQYIDWLYKRVEEMYRVLKPTGSFYLHCDWHANAYIRVMILDRIFGDKNFVNEIVWCYASGGVSKYYFAKKHDTVFLYRKTDDYVFNAQYREYSEGTKQRGLTASKKKINENYALNKKGAIMNDWWNDIVPLLSPTCKERIGYPTQKPEALLERIIKASSNPGDIVLDAICGGGTTPAVASRLNRKFIAIDKSRKSVEITNERLCKQEGRSNYDIVLWNLEKHQN